MAEGHHIHCDLMPQRIPTHRGIRVGFSFSPAPGIKDLDHHLSHLKNVGSSLSGFHKSAAFLSLKLCCTQAVVP